MPLELEQPPVERRYPLRVPVPLPLRRPVTSEVHAQRQRAGPGCRNRGPGGAATAYANTWALGRLAPGHTVAFRWRLTAVEAGPYAVEYEVAPALNSSAKAVLRTARRPVADSTS